MKILVMNAGSSSLKFKLYEMRKETILIQGHVDGIGLKFCKIILKANGKETVKKQKVANHTQAVKIALSVLGDLKDIKAVGHRVVHGGEYYTKAMVITPTVIKRIDELKELAPLHNPPNLAGIKACKKLMPRVKQVAVFDTAFHSTLPPKAFLYGIDYKHYKKDKIRRYGFHGTSHKYVAMKAAEILGVKISKLKIITCHLGNGASIAAIDGGKSIDTSMGFTPLEGLVMGTRSGDLDPEIIPYLMKKYKLKASEVVHNLNKKSGLLGLSGISSDVRVLHQSKSKMAKLALEVDAYRIKKYIGSYLMALGGLDILIFTGGIGENAYYLRKTVCDSALFNLDSKANRKNELIISDHDSHPIVMVIPTNEGLMIAKETAKLI